jgi:CRP-like cAMP-binding protein
MRLLKDDLQELALFSDTSRTQLAHIGRQLTQLNLPAGRMLVREGAHGDEFMIIVEGQAEVRQNGRIIARIGRGELVGEMALLDASGQGKRNATVTAITDVTIHVGSTREFQEMMLGAPSVAEKVHETVASRNLSAA